MANQEQKHSQVGKKQDTTDVIDNDPDNPANLIGRRLGTAPGSPADTDPGTMLDERVLEALLASDRVTEGRPVLPEGGREEFVRQLRVVLADGGALTTYTRRLLALACPAPASACRHHELLDEQTLGNVLASGSVALDDSGLARLMLNPRALSAAHDALLDRMLDGGPVADEWLDAYAEAWADDFTAAGERMLRRRGLDVDHQDSRIMPRNEVIGALRSVDEASGRPVWTAQTSRAVADYLAVVLVSQEKLLDHIDVL